MTWPCGHLTNPGGLFLIMFTIYIFQVITTAPGLTQQKPSTAVSQPQQQQQQYDYQYSNNR